MKNVLARRGATPLRDPFSAWRDLHEEMNRLWDVPLVPARLWRREESLFAPEVDVREEKDHIVVRADIPGVKKEDLSVTIREDILTLKGERKEEHEKKEKDLYRSERFYGVFSRSIGLPSAVKADSVKATYRDGVLELNLPKMEGGRPHEVKVQIQ